MASRSPLLCLILCCTALDVGSALPLAATADASRLPGSPALSIKRASPLDLGLKPTVDRLRGGAGAAVAAPAKPRGLHLGPIALVASFTICNLLNYVDRGLVNGVLPTLGEDFHVSKTHLGALTGAFMGGYCALCPIFAYLSNIFPPFLLMGIGLTVWEISAVMAASAPTFQWLLAARVLSGVGEASFQAIAPPFLDDAATDSNRGSMLAIFFCAIPVGTALGYVFGGYMEKLYSWRQGFYVLAALMAPLTLTCFFVNNTIKKPPAPAVDAAKPGIIDLFRNKVWLAATLGYSAWTFTIGAFAVWGPTLLHSVHKLPLDVADLHFGAITVAMGILGTAVGGVLLDKITKKGAKPELEDKKEDLGGGGGGIVTMSLMLCSALTAVAMPFLFLAFSNAPLSVFYFGMVLGEFFLFSTTAPLNGVFLWCVSAEQRSMSLAVANLVIHLLGDVLSPVIAGWLWTRTGSGTTAMTLVSAWLGWGVLLWALGAAASRNA